MPGISPSLRRYANTRIASASPDEWMVPSGGKDERGPESDECSLIGLYSLLYMLCVPNLRLI